MSGHFRRTIWDPLLIIAQIVCLQSFFYFTFGALLISASLLIGIEVTLRNIFNHKEINFIGRDGVVSIMCYVANALFGSVGLWVLVKRTKQCLDFSVTCYLIHLLLVWIYTGSFPTIASWWILSISGCTIMCVCGEFLCLRSELKDIPLLGSRVEL